jgi:hypothetical protein
MYVGIVAHDISFFLLLYESVLYVVLMAGRVILLLASYVPYTEQHREQKTKNIIWRDKENMIRMTQGHRCFFRNAGVGARRCANPRRPALPPSARKHISRDSPIRANYGGSPSYASSSSSNANAGATVPASIKYAKTTAGTGDPEGLGGSTAFSTRGPVTWPALGLVAIAAASAVGYYKIERERRLENAMGKIVS